MNTPFQQNSLQVRNLRFKVENVGKFFDWSKKSYIWTFEAKKSNMFSWIPIRIQFLDSLKSGKRTLLLNDSYLLNKVYV
jgi:hypothetical protein